MLIQNDIFSLVFSSVLNTIKGIFEVLIEKELFFHF